MAIREIICAFIFAACLNLILTIEDTDEDYEIEKNARVVGRAYSLTGCDYGTQAGYTCLSCNRALHCYFGGAAIMVDCYGLFRFCRDGHCGRHQGEKCFSDNRITTAAPYLNISSHVAQTDVNSQSENIPQSVLPANDQPLSDFKSTNLDDVVKRGTLNVSKNVVIHGVSVDSNLAADIIAPVVNTNANE